MALTSTLPGGLPPFGPLTTLTQPTLDVVPLLGILGIGGLYLYAVLRLRQHGTAWPVGRTISFVVGGLGTLAIALLSGLAAYDTTLFGAHMLQHMLLTMIAPVFLALGAPVTLALRTLPLAWRKRLLAVLHSRLSRLLTFPPLAWISFVATPFALYMSGLYEQSLVHPLLHELLHVHFVIVGCLFFWPLLGLDPVPGRVGYGLRMLMSAATLPFHAFLGIAIMSVDSTGAGIIAKDWYLRFLTVPEAIYQQKVGGGLLWSSGDVVGLFFLFVMLYQWMKASEREAVREDRRLDRLDAAAARR